MTHRLCIRAGPSTLEAGRVTTTTLLPPLHSGSSSSCADRRPIGLLPALLRVTEERDALPLRAAEPSPREGEKKNRFSLGRHVVTATPPSPSSILTRDILLGSRPKRSGRYRATRRSPVRTLAATADGGAHQGPHELPSPGAPSVPHRRVRSGVNAPGPRDSSRPSSVDPPRFFALLSYLPLSRALLLCFTCGEGIRMTDGCF